VTGVLQDVLTGAPMPGGQLKIGAVVTTTAGADGAFVLATEPGRYTVSVSGTEFVRRVTQLRVPGPDASITLIPNWFPLATFDEMCRVSGRLKRWTSAPALVVIATVLQFTDVSDSSFVATPERLSVAELDGIVADLTWGLPLATGEAFTAFRSVTTETPSEGSRVAFFEREGAIVVARFTGLQASTRYWGFGRWAARGDEVAAGAILLDRDFERSSSPFHQTLRVHEMGHALGWGHVSTTRSFMESSAMRPPDDSDRRLTRLAFMRPPGNVSPDTDPYTFSTNVKAFPLVWGPITP
jgi:hypothetical protein